MGIKKAMMLLLLMVAIVLPAAAGMAEPYISAGLGVIGGADSVVDTAGGNMFGTVGGDVGLTGVFRLGGDIAPSFSMYAVGSFTGLAAPWETSQYYGLMGDVGLGIGGVVRWGIAALHVDLQGIAVATSDNIDAETGFPQIYFGGRLTLEPEVMIAPAREWFGFALSFPISFSMTTAGWNATGGIMFTFSLGDHLEGY